jgi:poly(3-hydroxybutyrate) depolymerase
MAPLRWSAQGLKMQLQSPLNPFRGMLLPRVLAASCELFENVTRRYGKPEWGIKETKIFGMPVPINEEIVYRKAFCNLVHFDREEKVIGRRYDPKVLIVAPLSGHYATLLRGTVEAMIREHDVYVTDWMDARMVPVTEGGFDLDDFIDYVIEFIQFLGPNTHVMAVCQPAVPVLAAAALMAARNDPMQPASLTLMGGPIDTRRNMTVVNKLAQNRPIEWFENNVINSVPFPNPGFMRKVYPGFIQLTGFMQMNLERHMTAHKDLFSNLVKGDCDSVQQHQTFYEEYLAVLDLSADFYLQTVKVVFQDHDLPDGRMMHRGELVDCRAIKRTALMTVEGEKDDICGLGQTEAAHDLCVNIPMDEKYHYVQSGVGHYGVFNGTRWRTEIQPRIREFIRTIQFKRMVGSNAKMSLPYRGLHEDREEIVEYSQPKQQPGVQTR